VKRPWRSALRLPQGAPRFGLFGFNTGESDLTHRPAGESTRGTRMRLRLREACTEALRFFELNGAEPKPPA